MSHLGGVCLVYCFSDVEGFMCREVTTYTFSCPANRLHYFFLCLVPVQDVQEFSRCTLREGQNCCFHPIPEDENTIEELARFLNGNPDFVWKRIESRLKVNYAPYVYWHDLVALTGGGPVMEI